MLNVQGKVKVFAIDDENPKAVKCSIVFGTPNKKSEGEWDNSFFKAVFIGKASEIQKQLEDKDFIYITSGTVTNKNYTNKAGENRSFLQVQIFDFIHGQEMEEHIENLKTLREGDKPKVEKGNSRGGRKTPARTPRGQRDNF
jgi:hypothetical protein